MERLREVRHHSGMRHWLVKTEPESFSLEDLKRLKRSSWEGVRNYQARNYMRDEMRKGDLVLIYHSNAKPPGVVGLGQVVKESYPDHFAWQIGHKYFDPASTPDKPRWFMVDVGYKRTFRRLVSLDELRGMPELAGMPLVNKSRLSVQPVSPEQFEAIVAAASTKAPRS